jgi:AraC family transcriptional regulator, regulatory protein of adaptative response / methylated-DNA-[protein]-cysteine methyltransferase
METLLTSSTATSRLASIIFAASTPPAGHLDVVFSVDPRDTLVPMKTIIRNRPLPAHAEMERAFTAKDRSYDGVFYVAVRSTGVFCRPSCPSQPLRGNIEFRESVKDCLGAGYRPCKRCRPLEADGTPPGWVVSLMQRTGAGTEARLKTSDLRALGISPERARRWFQRHCGMSFAAWWREYRLAGAFARLRAGASLDDTAFASGYESHSGFREAFGRTFGQPPGRSRRRGDRIVTAVFGSPLGPLLAGATDAGICRLEFTDPRLLPSAMATMRRQFECAVVPGKHPLLDQLRTELKEYFTAGRREFRVPLSPGGTQFQVRVWETLRCIPYGKTLSYAEVARRIGQPTALRAVARANATNRLCLLIPCHRVIGKDGSLTGYGGGLWRKRLLLELERSGNLPGQ